MKIQYKDSFQWICFAVLVFLGGLFSFFFLQTNGEAENVSTSVSVQNATPTVDEVHVNSVSTSSFSDAITILPSPGGTKMIYLNGSVTDPNGDADVASVSASFARSGSGTCGYGGENDDKNFCYHKSVCTISPVNGDDSATFSCAIPIWYFIDPTTNSSQNWIASVRVKDANVATGTATTTVEIGEIVSIGLPGIINYGSLYPSETTNTETNTETQITQAGNSVVDLNLAGTTMTCSFGSIPYGNISYSLTDSAGGTPLSTTLHTLTTFNLGLRTDDTTETNKDLYWNLSVPTGVSGSCSGSITITAISDL